MLAALADKTAPEKRQALNDAYASISGQIGELLSGQMCRWIRGSVFAAYRQQLGMARYVSLSTQAEELTKTVIGMMLADLDAR